MKKILITGVAGFIGSHVATRFLREGFAVVGVDDLSSGRLENVPKGLEFIKGNLALTSTIEKLPKDCNKILHLAGQSSGEISFDDPVADLEKNTISTLNLIFYGIKNKIERLVYASSMSVYGDVEDKPISENHDCFPLSCYGVGKYAAENYLYIYQNQLASTVLRMFNVYGPGQDLSNLRQGMVSIYLAQALNDGQIKVKGNTKRFRDLIYIDDVVDIWFRAATYKSALGKTFNVGTGIKTSVEQLLNKICFLIPNSNFHVQGKTPGDQSGIFADISKLQSHLGVTSFVSVDVGLENFINWTSKSHR